MRDRREIWTAVRLRTCAYVITEAVRAPSGPLKGTITVDEATGAEVVTLAGDTDDTVDVVWPDLDDVEILELIQGIVAANTTGTLPPELVLRHLLVALGVRDVESILKEMEDADGNFQWPKTAATAGMMPGQGGDATALAAAGGDPATAGLPGSMGPDDQGPGYDPAGDVPGSNRMPLPGRPPAAPGTPGAPGAPGKPGAIPGQVGAAVVPADGPLAMQNDADFGLFGGSDTAAPAPDDGSAGEQPDDAFDPAFFDVEAQPGGDAGDQGDGMDDQPDDQTPPPAKPRKAASAAALREAAAAQGDADFGLGKPTAADDAQLRRDAGTAGATPRGAFDPDFFKI
jgi:hypothetical protein